MPRPIDRLLAIMARLRDPAEGCPWDKEQSFATIAPHTIEEAYEVADAILHGDMDGLKDELGDLLFQVVYHAQMASEAGTFAFDDVAQAISDKMVRRHPHVFGEAEIKTAEAQTAAWETQKAAERRAKAASAEVHSALDGVTPGLPALTRALKLQRRAARVGFDWPSAAEVLPKLAEETAELTAELAHSPASPARVAAEIGDLLFTLVNLARKLDVDPETALRGANLKFERRFKRVEALAAAEGRTVEDEPLDRLDGWWNRAKAEEAEATNSNLVLSLSKDVGASGLSFDKLKVRPENGDDANVPGFFPPRALDALALASRLHGGQTRKGTNIPYVSHLLATAALVMEFGGGETEAIAALLHDAPEDCGGRPVLNAIREQFGEAVAGIVEACTDTFEDPKPAWEPRKRAYLAALPHHSASARLVACADKLHNARSLLTDYREVGEDLWTRFTANRAQTLWYYRALADEFRTRGPLLAASELDRVVTELERLVQV